MAKSIHTLHLSIILFICFNQHAFSQCNAKQIMKDSKPNIPKPYKYDSYAISEFIFDNTEKNVEVIFTAFTGQKYKLIFCSSGFEEPVKMNIYNKSVRVKKDRKKLYDNAEGIDNNFWSFEPTKSGNYYIEYSIPKSLNGKVKKGCVVLLIGCVDKSAK